MVANFPLQEVVCPEHLDATGVWLAMAPDSTTGITRWGEGIVGRIVQLFAA